MAARRDQVEVRARIVIRSPVPGVAHSLQCKGNAPLDPKVSKGGEPLSFDFPLRVGPGPQFFGDQVRPEGKVRRFVYVRVGTMAGQHDGAWTRRMKIDIHDTPQSLVDQVLAGDRVLVFTVDGTATDGSPACATVKPVEKAIE